MKITKISVSTFNIQGTSVFSRNTYSRISKASSSLNKTDTIILNLQELFTYYHLFLFKKKLSNFPYFSFENFVFGPKGGLVTFSKIPIEREKYVSYSKLSIFKKLFLGKGILVSKIKDQPFFIINTHLTANRDNNWSKTNRFYSIHISQIEQLQNTIKLIKNSLIISGDFNISKNSDLYMNMINKLQVLDTFKKYNSPTFHVEFMKKGEESNRIDFLFIKTKRKFTIVKTNHLFATRFLPKDINQGFLSDHLGLQATFRFKE